MKQDASTGELFAQVTYASPWNQVEPVLDSSRYFVLRVEGDGGKRAYIGMGFAERGDAFDFQVSLIANHRIWIWFLLDSDGRSYHLATMLLSMLTPRSLCNQSPNAPLPARHPTKTHLNHPNQPPHQKTIL